MNKKLFLSIIAAIAVVMTFSSCNRGTKVNVDGKDYYVDPYVVEHYNPIHVENALKRAYALRNVIIATSASTFGKKMAEVKWSAFEEDMKADKFAKKAGTVTVVHYEHGLEIIKEGQSWFYDGFPYEESNLTYISASLAILDRPRWEPASIRFSDTGINYEYLDLKNYDGWESWRVSSTAREAFGIHDIDDVILEYKKY